MSEGKLKYKCLVLDHDDTVMDSTRLIHHPAFLVYLREVRPGFTISLWRSTFGSTSTRAF